MSLPTWLRGAVAVALAALAATTASAQSKNPVPTDPKGFAGAVEGALKSGGDLDAAVNAAGRGVKAADAKANAMDGKWKNAKQKAEAAAKAADKVHDASQNCVTEADKKKIQGQLDAARKQLDAAQKQSDDLDAEAKKITADMQKGIDAVDSMVKNVNSAADAAAKDAAGQTAADGKKGASAITELVQRNVDRFNKAVEKMNDGGTAEKKFADKGPMAAVREAGKTVEHKLDTAKSNHDPSQDLDQAKKDLDNAQKNLDNCPKQTGMVVPEEKHVTIPIDDRPQYAVCIDQGQDAQAAMGQLGITEGSVVASADGQTVVRTPTDPKTVEKNAKDKNIKLCFPIEDDFCVIMTPLTKFRGHEHARHLHSGRAVHDHDAPDPPLDWGRDPPETIIELERSR